jgi:hypothetical protein
MWQYLLNTNNYDVFQRKSSFIQIHIHINTFCEENAEVFNTKEGGVYIVTSMFQRVNRPADWY